MIGVLCCGGVLVGVVLVVGFVFFLEFCFVFLVDWLVVEGCLIDGRGLVDRYDLIWVFYKVVRDLCWYLLIYWN